MGVNIQEELARPFGPEDIKSYTAGRAGTLTYIDARSVMNRLDEVVGLINWQTKYVIQDHDMKAVECQLSVRIDGEWITKADVGFPNEGRDADNADKEPLKAAYSDALKRAAVQFGIGRHLYDDKKPRRADPASIAPAEASPGRNYDATQLLTLMGEFSVTKEDLIKVTGTSTNGNPQVSKWLSMNQGKTINDLISRAVDTKVPA